MTLKSSYDSAVTFFENMKGNPALLSNTPDPLYQGYLDVLRAKQDKDDDATRWAVSKPVKGDYGDSYKVSIDVNGVVARPSNYRIVADTRKEMLANRPTSIRAVGTGIDRRLWITSMHSDIAVFNERGSYVGGFGKIGIDYDAASDVAVNETLGLVAVACELSHIVRIFKAGTKEVVATIGKPQNAGEPTADGGGLLYSPASIVWVGNQLLIACRGGTVNTEGSISVWSQAGEFVSVLAASGANGLDPWHGGICDPVHLFYVEDSRNLYVTSRDKNYVSVWALAADTSSMTYSSSYGRTGGGFGGGILRPSSCCADEANSRLYITMTDPDVLVCFDTNSGLLVGKFGKMAWDDAAAQHSGEVRLNNVYQLSSVVLSGDTLFLAVRGNNRVISLPTYLLYGEQTLRISYTPVVITTREVVRASKSHINVDPYGNVSLSITREEIYSYGLGEDKVVFVLLRELDR